MPCNIKRIDLAPYIAHQQLLSLRLAICYPQLGCDSFDFLRNQGLDNRATKLILAMRLTGKWYWAAMKNTVA